MSDPNEYLKPMIATRPRLHAMADAFLAWLQDNNIEPLTTIAEKAGFTLSMEGSLLRWSQNDSATFYMAMLQDIASSKELTDAVSDAHQQDLLPLLIVQYSNDPTDNRGENVFDLFSSTRELAITHANRVYTKKSGN